MVEIDIFRQVDKMKISLLLLTLISLVIICCGQNISSVEKQVATQVEPVASTKAVEQKILTFDPRSYTASELQHTDEFIDTEFKYSDSAGNNIIIQNSFPKGGDYYDSTGRYDGYRLFWTRIVNETPSNLDLSIDFPAESFGIYKESDAYFKLFLPPDTVSIDGLTSKNWGISGLNSFLNTVISKSTLLDRTINPNEEYIFFTGLLGPQGTVRAAVVPQGKDLFYRVSIDPFGSTKIPIGQFAFKN